MNADKQFAKKSSKMLSLEKFRFHPKTVLKSTHPDENRGNNPLGVFIIDLKA